MALLINKPKRVVINTTANLILNRAELAGYFAGNAYFSNTANWDKVYFYYRDASGKQNINVFFPANLNVAPLSPSLTARQSKWNLEKIIIRDFDRGFVTLNRKQYFSALSECDIVIAVANRTPSDIFLSNTSPLENQTFVGNLTATDPDILDPLTYTVVSSFEDGASFQIVGNNALHFVTAPNFEVKNQYSVKIRVTDSSDAFYEEAFTINVVDANDAPSDIALSNNTILENSNVNTVVGTLSAIDEDAGATVTFSLVGGDTSAFNLNGNQLRSSVSFNYEEKASYSVTIRATDNVGATYDEVFNISVLNENEAPTGIALSSNTINEWNSINGVVGVLSTSDVDGGDTFTYTIIGGDVASFNINGNQLRATHVFDFETKSSYSVTIRSTDAGGLTYDKSFTITVANISEAPTDIALSGNTINENAAVNTVIGTFSVTAPTTQSATYSLVGGDVASFNISGNQLRSSASFNFEAKSSYSVTVRASVGGESFDKALAINVNNVPEPPSDILLSNSSIAENNSVNAVIGTLSAVGDTVTYSFVGGDTSAFNINGNELRASIAFDRESKASYSVTIRGTTPFGLTLDRTFAITITDVNEFAPTGASFTSINGLSTINGWQYTYQRNTYYGTPLTHIYIKDQDYYNTIGGTYAHNLKLTKVDEIKEDRSRWTRYREGTTINAYESGLSWPFYITRDSSNPTHHVVKTDYGYSTTSSVDYWEIWVKVWDIGQPESTAVEFKVDYYIQH